MSTPPSTYAHDVSLIQAYFTLTPLQLNKLHTLSELYTTWNQRLNLISRKDIQHLYIRHILHSLSIAKVISFMPGTQLLDLGTGGGFPGIPLAILFPHVHFTLADSIAKKIKAVEAIIQALKLDNVDTQHIRAEDLQETYHFVISRAVAPLHKLYQWTKGKIKTKSHHHLPNGLLYLKGGHLHDELTTLDLSYKIYHLNTFFKEPFFNTKTLVHLFHYPLSKQ